MNLQQLRYFSTLAQTCHFGEAAKRLFITQPTLSNSISKLETELGFPLLDRSQKTVTMTTYGLEFQRHIDAALHEIDLACNVMGPNAIETSPTIRVGMVASVQSTFLPELMSRYIRDTRRIIDFDMHESYTTFQCLQLLREDQLDVAFCARIPRDESLEWVPVCPQSACIVVNSDHPLANYKEVSLKDLRGYPLISYRDSSYLYYVFRSLLQEENLDFTQAFRAETNGVTRVLADPRVVAVMTDTVEGDIRNLAQFIPIKEVPGAFHMVGMVHSKNTDLSQETCDFIEYVQGAHLDLQSVVPFEERYFDQY